MWTNIISPDTLVDTFTDNAVVERLLPGGRVERGYVSTKAEAKKGYDPSSTDKNRSHVGEVTCTCQFVSESKDSLIPYVHFNLATSSVKEVKAGQYISYYDNDGSQKTMKVKTAISNMTTNIEDSNDNSITCFLYQVIRAEAPSNTPKKNFLPVVGDQYIVLDTEFDESSDQLIHITDESKTSHPKTHKIEYGGTVTKVTDSHVISRTCLPGSSSIQDQTIPLAQWTEMSQGEWKLHILNRSDLDRLNATRFEKGNIVFDATDQKYFEVEMDMMDGEFKKPPTVQVRCKNGNGQSVLKLASELVFKYTSSERLSVFTDKDEVLKAGETTRYTVIKFEGKDVDACKRFGQYTLEDDSGAPTQHVNAPELTKYDGKGGENPIFFNYGSQVTYTDGSSNKVEATVNFAESDYEPYVPPTSSNSSPSGSGCLTKSVINSLRDGTKRVPITINSTGRNTSIPLQDIETHRMSDSNPRNIITLKLNPTDHPHSPNHKRSL